VKKSVVTACTDKKNVFIPDMFGARSVTKYRMYHLKRNSKTITHNGTKMKSEAGPPPCNRLFQPPRDTRVKVTLVARPLHTPVAQKLCRCERGVFMNRTCVDSGTLLRIEIVCCSS
jgi:hypothetical protein